MALLLFSLGMGASFNAILDRMKLVACSMDIGSLNALIRPMYLIGTNSFLWNVAFLIRKKHSIKQTGNLRLEN